MSSLLSTASVWEPNDNTTILKKRTPATNANIRKTVKNRARGITDNEEYNTEESPLVMGSGNSGASISISELQTHNLQKQSRVNELLNQITNVNAQNDSSKLGDFVPITNSGGYWDPKMGKVAANNTWPKTDGVNALLPKYGRGGGEIGTGIYSPNEPASGKFSNYQSAHDPTGFIRSTNSTTPYYSKMGIGKDDRMMEKINYMVRILEEQQLEKTNHITEEFLLYTLLGVFVIYVVDSFSRAGKYMR